MKDEDYIEKLIRENRDKFVHYNPPENHMKRFMLRLNLRIKHVISIVPYLVRVAVATIAIFIASVIVYNNFIRKDGVSLGYKISLILKDKKK
ncbi:MAG TPA: hypothetical protein VK207_09325 [Bacteroidales bacterium]|nr:hypothetical protein [Bacteroidales bacterium]